MVYAHARPCSSSVVDERSDLWSIRARCRLELLEALSARLADLGVPHLVKRHTDNAAPSDPSERTIPALIIGGEWARVRVLYWDGRPFFTVWDTYTRYPTDEAGVERLAVVLAGQWHDTRRASARIGGDYIGGRHGDHQEGR
ncbi:MAG: hypothetical protein GEV03_05500 [Streptosporangiales bacterium]|nr:hypothetical protein [Streptosporangiales bacterium]